MKIVVSTFRRQAVPMTWDYAEANPFATSSGSVGEDVGGGGKGCCNELAGANEGSATQSGCSNPATAARVR